MSSSDTSCYTVVFESGAEYPSASELRSCLEKGSDEVKIDTLRRIILSTINGNPQVSRISLLLFTLLIIFIANTDDADHSICYAFTEQAVKETSPLLLGGLPEI